MRSLARSAGFLEAALELAIAERDAGFFAGALGEVAKARVRPVPTNVHLLAACRLR